MTEFRADAILAQAQSLYLALHSEPASGALTDPGALAELATTFSRCQERLFALTLESAGRHEESLAQGERRREAIRRALAQPLPLLPPAAAKAGTEGRRQKAEGSPDGAIAGISADAPSRLPSAFCLLPPDRSLLPSAPAATVATGPLAGLPVLKPVTCGLCGHLTRAGAAAATWTAPDRCGKHDAAAVVPPARPRLGARKYGFGSYERGPFEGRRALESVTCGDCGEKLRAYLALAAGWESPDLCLTCQQKRLGRRGDWSAIADDAPVWCDGCQAKFAARLVRTIWPLPDLCNFCAAAAEPAPDPLAGVKEIAGAEVTVSYSLGGPKLEHVRVEGMESCAANAGVGVEIAAQFQRDHDPNPYSRKRPLARGNNNNWRAKKECLAAKTHGSRRAA